MLVRVLERQYDQYGKQKFEKRIDRAGQQRTIDKFKVYYMDLTEKEEQDLRQTHKFSFESIRENELTKLDKKLLQEGAARKKEVIRQNLFP